MERIIVSFYNDESMDVSDNAQVVIFIYGINRDFTIVEE